MSVIGKHGITPDTPKNVLLGAGTYMKGLKFADGKWTGTVIGATNGGGKVSIKGEFQDLELDGALVKFKGQTVKQGGTANIEANFAEISEDVLQMATLFEQKESDADGYVMLQDKANISEGDYVEGFGFVGKTADGSKDIIVIFEYGLCISGLELEGKNKEQAVIKLSIDAYAENEGDLDTLPVKIYYPLVA
jgi:hypothetical protein